MKRTSTRTVVGFFSAGQASTERGNSSDAIRSIRPLAGHISQDGRYSPLRLSGESIIVARVTRENVPAVVETLRSAGLSAVFALSDEGEPAPRRASRPGASSRRWILGRLSDWELAFNAACADLDQAVLMEHALSPAAEWLLDNSYLVREHVSKIRQHLPRRFPSGNGAAENIQLYAQAAELVRRTDSNLTAAGIADFLRERQQQRSFSTAELWLFPLLVRMALIGKLAELASGVNRSQQLREAAYLWANRLATSGRRGDDELEQMIGRMETDPLTAEPHFAISLAGQLQDEDRALAAVQRSFERRFGTRLDELAQAEHTREAAERISAANAFGSLRMLSRMDFESIFEAVSPVEAALRTDPAGVYPRSDFRTRDDARHVVEQVARYSGRSEVEIARSAVALAEANHTHVAWFLLADGLKQLEAETDTHPPFRTRLIRGVRRHATPIYLIAIAALTLSFTALALAVGREAGVHRQAILAVLGLLALFPLSELAIEIVNALVVSLLPPRHLPKMDFREKIPDACATLVAVPMLLAGAEVVRAELEKLEVRYLANPEANLWYALVSDFTDSADPTALDDNAVLTIARDGIAALNRRHEGHRFLLFHRRRVWSESEQRWIGRERKRGKLEELNAFLSGEGAKDFLHAGELARQIRYVITLDADTQLPPGAARRMIETIAHPLNQVELDPETRVRLRGFSIIQPRVSIALPEANSTRFTRVFGEAYGTDPYSLAISDAQQDLFGEAMFHGKAIYDVHPFTAALADRFPPETLLSHDLIEGAHAGVALATDIELFENLPQTYAAFTRREHRWIRGDWQIARWLLPRVTAADGTRRPNPLTLVNRWRILDNLRRSLVPVASLLLLLFGWLISDAPGVWTLVVGLAIAIPALAPLLDRGARHVQGSVSGWQGAADQLIRAAVMVAFLPHQAWVALDAIVRANYRAHFSRRKLLEWETAERSGALVRRHLNSTLRRMLAISALACLLMIALEARRAFAPTFLFVLLWAVAPALMLWLSRPARLPRGLDRRDTAYLRHRARLTWRFFDDLVNEETHWLPPDNSQLALHIEVAARTSPTNIGLWLAAALAARDLGYSTADDFLLRASNTMATLSRLERYEGHLLNWYDTRTLEALNPRYVSTVDSGNLLASLWTLASGCRDVLYAPIAGAAATRGLSDTLAILNENAGRDLAMSGPLRQVRRLLYGSAAGHELIGRIRLASIELRQMRKSLRWATAKPDERAYWLARFSAELDAWNQTADRYLRWMETLAAPPDAFLQPVAGDAVKLRRRALTGAPTLAILNAGSIPPLDAILSRRGSPDLAPEVGTWLDQLHAEYAQARANAAETAAKFSALADSALRLASEIDMRFLYDSGRRVFAIGYAVGSPREFTSHYDLLASECRLASMVAIAKGDVPAEHWVALGRLRSAGGHSPVLLSWSGTMFEYLMPLLFERSFPGSLLDRACREAVERQIEYGREKKIPWGVSESAYSALDANQTYQYRAFGVPELALKRGLEDDLVVAPYATMLALLVDPASAVENLKRLEELGLAGPMGFYESIDFARERKRGGERGVVIYAYMAHHQGMSLVALDDVLHRGVMTRRFHADLRIRAFESLLWERASIARQPRDQIETRHAPMRRAMFEEPAERTWKEPARIPRIHLNGNGRYTLVLTSSGGGYSRWGDFDITRWRSDPALDHRGSFLYLRDTDSNQTWSATPQPVTGTRGVALSSVTFSADRAQFRRMVSGIETTMDITVAADEDAELRRVTIVNRSIHPRTIELTSYLELVMAPHRADTAHPAFAKMFVETEWLGDGVLIARRRPRSAEDAPIWTAHVLAGNAGPVSFETDRAGFLGRARSTRAPEALERDLARTAGAVLDPIFSLRCRLKLDARARAELAFLTIAASSRETLLEAVAKCRRAEFIARAFEMAWTRTQLEMRYLGINPAAAHRFQELAGRLLYPDPAMRRTAHNVRGQAALWAYGISGDLPMLAVTIGDARGAPLVRELLLAQAWWKLAGFRADVIILNQEGVSYDQPLHQQLQRLIDAHASQEQAGHGHAFLLDWPALPEQDRNLILSSSAVVLSGARGPLAQQMITTEPAQPPAWSAKGGVAEQPSPPLPFLELPFFNGLGGFSPDGREYAIYLDASRTTPAAWINVMANANFGAAVSESGLGFTWSRNSQSNRLTTWHNDPVSDPQPEAIYLRDDESGALWTPTPLPIRENDAYRARHGHGYTAFEHNSHAIGQELCVFVPPADPVKIYRLRLRNDSSRVRRLTVTWFAELVLGAVREEQQLHVETSFDAASGAIFAAQSWQPGSAEYVAFAASNPRAQSWSGDRTGFLGRNGSFEKPAALARVSLDQRCGAGLDPCAALQFPIALAPAETRDVVLVFGQAKDESAARDIVARYATPGAAEHAFSETREAWESILTAIQVRTPLASADVLLNRWLLYQVLSCRFYGRSAMYQSGGAFGFRDQLQDVLALVYAAPEIARRHILDAAARQFVEGDVQHWWHPDTGLGVRTRCSDDLLWLPYAAARYIEITGDLAILDESAAFLEGPALDPGEQERMFVSKISAQRATLREHLRRALEHAWKIGAHGLPLIGSGDWNDGLNRVGVEGRGESVWLAWFFCAVLESFARLSPDAAAWRARAVELARAVERTAWDGDWYLRGFFDNGSPLGAHGNLEARIDSLAQSWAVISGAGDPARARRAMDSATAYLVDERDRLVRLFTPPFDHSTPHPGYIMGYPPGVRENGGQYTHGSLWMAMARARLGEGDAAVHLLQLMNPVEHTLDAAGVAAYVGEPYVAAADVYASPNRAGRGGWTWYTGSAAWMYRIWIEEVLGFRLRGDTLTIDPSIPADWPGFEIEFRYRSTHYEIAVRKLDSAREPVSIPLVNDGATHRLTVPVPPRPARCFEAKRDTRVVQLPASSRGALGQAEKFRSRKG